MKFLLNFQFNFFKLYILIEMNPRPVPPCPLLFVWNPGQLSYYIKSLLFQLSLTSLVFNITDFYNIYIISLHLLIFYLFIFYQTTSFTASISIIFTVLNNDNLSIVDKINLLNLILFFICITL